MGEKPVMWHNNCGRLPPRLAKSLQQPTAADAQQQNRGAPSRRLTRSGRSRAWGGRCEGCSAGTSAAHLRGAAAVSERFGFGSMLDDLSRAFNGEGCQLLETAGAERQVALTRRAKQHRAQSVQQRTAAVSHAEQLTRGDDVDQDRQRLAGRAQRELVAPGAILRHGPAWS